MPEILRQDITGLILAGGQGSRMGGVDKGLQLLHGQPLVSWVIAHLVPQTAGLLISANRNLDRYAGFGYPVLTDDAVAGWGGDAQADLQTESFAGPLAGLHAGLSRCPTPWLLSAPCDVPDLPADLARHLASAAQQQDCPIAIAVSAGRRHPVITLLHRDVLPDLKRYLATGRRSVFGWQAGLPHVEVDFPADTFANLNTLDALASMEQSGNAFLPE